MEKLNQNLEPFLLELYNQLFPDMLTFLGQYLEHSIDHTLHIINQQHVDER